MLVSTGNLDALVGLSGSASELYGVNVQSGASAGAPPAQTLRSATVEVTDASPPGASVGTDETFTITSVDDASDTAVVTFSFFGVPLAHVSETILGFSPSAILFSDVPASTVATKFDQGAYASLDGALGVFSTSSLDVGAVLTLSGDDAYTGAAAALPVAAPGPTATPAPAASVVATTPAAPAAATPTDPASPTAPAIVLPGIVLPSIVLPTIPILPTVAVTLLPTQATVAGGGTNTLTLNFATAALAAQAQPELAAITAAIAAGSTVWGLASGGAPPTLAAGVAGLAEIDAGEAVSLPAGYAAVADLASSSVSVIAAAAGNHLVVAGGGGDLTYAAAAGADTIYAGSGNTLAFGGAASLDVFGGAGAASLIGGGGGNTIAGGGGAQLIFGSSTLNYVGGAGAATIIGGGGGNTVSGGSGALLLFASSSMTYTAGGGAATVIGGSGKLIANLGSGGGTAYGGVVGGNTLSTSSATQSILVGGGTGDVLTAAGSGADVLVAGAGAETIGASAATGNLVIFGGSGPDVLSGGAGNDLFVPESGNETLTGGGGGNSYAFIEFGATARTDVITDFDPTKDAIGLFGYSAQAAAAALASATVSAGATTLTLADGTHIVFAGAPTLTANNFF